MLKQGCIALLITVLAGCASDGSYNNTAAGAAIGAVAGGILGHRGGSSAAGAVVGALAGAMIGNYMDDQQRDMERALTSEKGRREVGIRRLGDDSLVLDVANEVGFESGRADIRPSFRPTLDRVGEVLRRYNRTNLVVIGHTDNVGSDSYNLDLSERRAGSVVGYLARYGGIADERMHYEGHGKREPRASNATEEGRAANRRVEIRVIPMADRPSERRDRGREED